MRSAPAPFTLWLRGAAFTVVVPLIVGGWLPISIADGHPAADWWRAGWVLVAGGALTYLLCLVRFIGAGGTPSIYFARPLRFVLGEEPPRLVTHGLYDRTRNPMYLGVVTAIAGLAIAYASWRIAAYGVGLFVFLNVVVRFIEEPHLRHVRGPEYDEYCRRVPRWI